MKDLISRQGAIDALNEQIEQCDKALSSFDISMKDEYAVKVERASLVAYKEQLEFLPSAQPKRKKGKWIEVDDAYNRIRGRCSACGWEAHMYEDDVVGMWFCPNCGADMRGEEDD